MIGHSTLMNYVGGRWEAPSASQTIPVRNPATGEVLAEAPLSTAADVQTAVQAALHAWPAWRRTTPGDRIQPLFRLKALLDSQFPEIARVITQECGKTLTESEGE
jgi:malonate-semialdehyde dehydrogenase (acetylating)/methylmalonate-semialdehyde dehydrogenase